MLSTLGGAASGVLITMWANSLIRRRKLAKPWYHLAFGITGGWIGYNLSKWENQLLIKANELRVERGFAPIQRVEIAGNLGGKEEKK